MPDDISTQSPEDVIDAERAAAAKNYEAIYARAPWLGSLHVEARRVVIQNGSRPVRLRSLAALADRVAVAMQPSTACRRGCNQCCHIAVPMTKAEAKIIGSRIGVEPVDARESTDARAMQRENFGRPCVFLEDGGCSIYEARPVSCRLHFHIGATPVLCDTTRGMESQANANQDLSPVFSAYQEISDNTGFADIRDFFPSGCAKPLDAEQEPAV